MTNINESHLAKIMSRVAQIGASDSDSDEVKLQKTVSNFSLIFGAIPVQTFLGITYLAFDESLTASILFGSSVITCFLLLLHGRHKISYDLYKFITLTTAYISPFFSTLLLGGIVESSFVIIWGLVGPMFALVLYTPKQAVIWFFAFCTLVIICVVAQPYLNLHNNIPLTWQTIIAAFNAINIGGMVFGALTLFVLQKEVAFRLLNLEKGKSESLLLNILPKDIADFLKNEPKVFADQYEQTSILFADVVDFTTLSSGMRPIELVEILNQVFSHFDDLVDKYGLEKIKTIGDCYMVASGIPRSRTDHAQAIASLALDMLHYVEKNQVGGKAISLRIGINSGPVVAGVIGRKKFIYDLWGDAVNVASRMESSGKAGAIQITKSTYDLIKEDFVCEPQAKVNVKGKGETEVWHLKGSRITATTLSSIR